jgi:integrase
MPDDDETLELFNLLNLPPGAYVVQRHRRWARAFEAWLHARRTDCHPSVGSLSHLAWREFLAFTRKPPWNVTVEDVDTYTSSLEQRGLSPRTIGHRLAALSSFYTYCRTTHLDAHGRSIFNPVEAARRPKRLENRNLRYLTIEAEAGLLAAIRRDDSPLGKRDYALFLALLQTGWKSGRVRTLTWGQVRAGVLGVTAQDDDDALPPAVCAAIREYLRDSGRLDAIQDPDVLFAPISYRLRSDRLDHARDWDGGRPLSSRQLLKLLKRHAGLAGLDAEAINCHTLRHTAAMRRLESGQSPDAVGNFLGRTAKGRNREYLRHLKKAPQGRIRARARCSLDQQPVPARKPRRLQRGNRLRLTHGLWSRNLPEFETLAKWGVRLHPLDADVLRWRIVIKRATILWEHIETVEEASLVLKVMSKAAGKLERAIKRRNKVRAQAKELGLEAELLEGWGSVELTEQMKDTNVLAGGFYNSSLEEGQTHDLEAVLGGDVRAEIALLRRYILRLSMLAKGVDDLEEAIVVLRAVSGACARVASLLRSQEAFDEDKTRDALERALAEVMKEFKLS